MNASNRRGFLKVAGVGAAAAGAAALATSAVSTTAAAPAAVDLVTPAALPAGVSGSMVAYVNDISTGEVSVMVEGREVTITDHQLVATLAHALHSSVTA